MIRHSCALADDPIPSCSLVEGQSEREKRRGKMRRLSERSAWGGRGGREERKESGNEQKQKVRRNKRQGDAYSDAHVHTSTCTPTLTSEITSSQPHTTRLAPSAQRTCTSRACAGRRHEALLRREDVLDVGDVIGVEARAWYRTLALP